MPTFDKRVLLILGIFLAGAVLALNGLRLANSQDSIAISTLTGEYDGADVHGEFHEQSVVADAEMSPTEQVAQVLGTEDIAQDEKWIGVDLATQSLYAYEGDKLIHHFLISSGKWGRTPTGTFRIWGKFRYTKMSGGSKALNTYYYLPNVPYVMFFSNDEIAASRGFSLHGTYWHENFGTPMSHGCVNMKTEEAGIIYDWSQPAVGDKKTARATEENPGTRVVIYGVAPKD